MQFTIEFDGEFQHMAITTSGVADITSSLRLNAELRTHPGYRRGMLILADHSSLDTSQLTDLDLERVAAAVSASEWNGPPRAVAIVMSTVSATERAKLAIAHLGGSRSNRRVFTSREEAVAWLQQQR